MKTILLVEDIAETRAWLREAAELAFPGCRISEATRVRDGLGLMQSQAFDLAILDLGLPDGDGGQLILAMKEHHPAATVVVATVMGDDASVITALSNGADGYLLKDARQDVFVRQLTAIDQGEPALSPSIARRIIEHFRRTAMVETEGGDLTPRERDVLSLIGRGLRNAEAASALGLSEHTIAGHIKSVYSKLGISTRAEAALLASRLGLT